MVADNGLAAVRERVARLEAQQEQTVTTRRFVVTSILASAGIVMAAPSR